MISSGLLFIFGKYEVWGDGGVKIIPELQLNARNDALIKLMLSQ